jgi:hypothetical protein
MGKRSRGYGAVYWRPDGRWEGQIRIPGGGRRSFYARTRRDVIHRLSEARWALGQGLPVSAGTTSLETYLGRWLALTESRLRPSTVRAYRLDAQRLLPFLGRVPLRSLTPGMIVSTYASLLQSGLSARSVEQTHCVLHLGLKQAMHCGIIGRNPSELVTSPRPRTREMTALNRSQLKFCSAPRLATAGIRYGFYSRRPACDSERHLALSGWTFTSLRAGWSSAAHFSVTLVEGRSLPHRRRKRAGGPSTYPM